MNSMTSRISMQRILLRHANAAYPGKTAVLTPISLSPPHTSPYRQIPPPDFYPSTPPATPVCDVDHQCERQDRQALSPRGCEDAAGVPDPVGGKPLGRVQTGYLAGGATDTGKVANRSGRRPSHATSQVRTVRQLRKTQTSRLTFAHLRPLPRFACQATIAAQSVRRKPCGRQNPKTSIFML